MYGEKLKTIIEQRSRAAVEDFYAPDAVLDANVPSWRFQRKGHGEIVAQFEEWYAEGFGRVVGIREWTTPWGAVVELEERAPAGQEQQYSRTVHVLFTEEGKVIRHISYCTGPWDPDTEARQKAEAPMVEP